MGQLDFTTRREKIIPRIVVWEKLQEKKVRRSNAPTASSSMVLFYLFWFLPANPFSDRFGLVFRSTASFAFRKSPAARRNGRATVGLNPGTLQPAATPFYLG